VRILFAAGTLICLHQKFPVGAILTNMCMGFIAFDLALNAENEDGVRWFVENRD
jgi:hypothetical protein